MVTAFKAASGDTVTINTKAHNDFQNQINTYLQGSPDDGFTWFAGYRMKYYAAKGLVAPLDDVWDKIGADNFGAGIVTASTGDDGKKYFVPNYNYPWAIFYRKSVFSAKGYTVPTTFDALKTLCAQMKKDGLTPIAFADKDGWPAMGTFDYLNMRAERLPVPRRPDGAQGELGPAEGQGRLRQLEGDPALHQRRRARPHLGGGGAARSPPRRPACTCSARSSPSSSPTRRCWPMWTSSRSRR